MHGGQTSGESGEGSRPYILLTLSAETRAQCDGMPAATLRPDATGTAFERVRGYDGQVRELAARAAMRSAARLHPPTDRWR